jgi:hypothetical protein
MFVSSTKQAKVNKTGVFFWGATVYLGRNGFPSATVFLEQRLYFQRTGCRLARSMLAMPLDPLIRSHKRVRT